MRSLIIDILQPILLQLALVVTLTPSSRFGGHVKKKPVGRLYGYQTHVFASEADLVEIATK